MSFKSETFTHGAYIRVRGEAKLETIDVVVVMKVT